jgi:hypothetical protein
MIGAVVEALLRLGIATENALLLGGRTLDVVVQL